MRKHMCDKADSSARLQYCTLYRTVPPPGGWLAHTSSGAAEGHGVAWIEGVAQLAEDDTAQVWREQHALDHLVRQWVVGHKLPGTAPRRPDVAERNQKLDLAEQNLDLADQNLDQPRIQPAEGHG